VRSPLGAVPVKRELNVKIRVRDVVALLVCLATCFGAAAIGSLFTGPAVSTW